MTERRRPTFAAVQRASRDPRFLAALQTVDDPRYEWSDEAACRGANPEAFFPDQHAPTAAAMRICGGCDVKAWCLADALATGDRYGIRNSTPDERDAMLAAWRATRKQVAS